MITRLELHLLPLFTLTLVGCVGDVSDGAEFDDIAAPSPAPVVAERTTGWATFDDLEPWTPPKTAARRSGERLTREELADALRPVISTPEGMFVRRTPNWAAADVLLRASEMDATPDGAPTSIARFFGADNRVRVPNTSLSPFNAIAMLFNDGATDLGVCTGTYIGPWTLVTSAHCLRVSTDGSIARRLSVSTEILEATPHNFSCNNADASTTNDFFAAIPVAYATSLDPAWDFAVIDTFPCHRAPHWFGEPATNQGVLIDPGTATYRMDSYPMTGTVAPAPWTAMFGMSGQAYANGPWLESQALDTQEFSTDPFLNGDRGAPWYIGSRLAAVNIGYREYFDFWRCGFDNCKRNFARRVDAGFMSFLRDIAFDY